MNFNTHMADQILFQCSNCGASITNSLNCEYCGSLLIRFEAQNIPLDILKYGKDGFAFPGLEDALKTNIELQKKYPAVDTCTDIDESTGTVNLQVCKSGMVEGKTFDVFTDKPGIEIALRFIAAKREDIQYWKVFEKLDIFKLFKINDIVLEDLAYKECHIDFGEDYVSAARMISIIIKEVYGLPESTEFTYNTWSDGEEQCSQFEVDALYAEKSRTTAALYALLLGALGAHQFYLGNTIKGIIYLLLCWTYIPGIIGFIEGIMILTQSDEEFYEQPKLIFK